jgi:hypothetical protein
MRQPRDSEAFLDRAKEESQDGAHDDRQNKAAYFQTSTPPKKGENQEVR